MTFTYYLCINVIIIVCMLFVWLVSVAVVAAEFYVSFFLCCYFLVVQVSCYKHLDCVNVCAFIFIHLFLSVYSFLLSL